MPLSQPADAGVGRSQLVKAFRLYGHILTRQPLGAASREGDALAGKVVGHITLSGEETAWLASCRRLVPHYALMKL